MIECHENLNIRFRVCVYECVCIYMCVVSRNRLPRTLPQHCIALRKGNILKAKLIYVKGMFMKGITEGGRNLLYLFMFYYCVCVCVRKGTSEDPR